MKHIRGFALIAPILVLLAGSPLRAQGTLFLSTGNDILTSNRVEDDLYSASVGFGIEVGDGFLELHERMFTDRQAGLRFDETWLVGSLRPRSLRSWGVELDGGAVHVGRGVFGEAAQNVVHRLIGSEEVDLSYIEKQRLHLVIGASARRSILEREHLSVGAHAAVRTALGFQSWGEVSARATWRPAEWLEVFGSVGSRISSTQYDALEPWIEPMDATASIGVGLWQRAYLSWGYNDYGTAMGHVHLGYRLKISRGTATRSDPGSTPAWQGSAWSRL